MFPNELEEHVGFGKCGKGVSRVYPQHPSAQSKPAAPVPAPGSHQSLPGLSCFMGLIQLGTALGASPAAGSICSGTQALPQSPGSASDPCWIPRESQSLGRRHQAQVQRVVGAPNSRHRWQKTRLDSPGIPFFSCCWKSSARSWGKKNPNSKRHLLKDLGKAIQVFLCCTGAARRRQGGSRDFRDFSEG